jgi:hypothetical protein
MSDVATREDWALLGIEPTTDEGTIRHAYAAALKSVNPESDPVGFQALRQAYERVLGQQTREAEGTIRPAPDGPVEEEVGAFLRKLMALRHAGDTDAAIGLIDRLVATRRPGDPVLAATADALFHTVALQRSLSARLFRHLVERFDWRDARGLAAQADPQRHSVIVARAAAEDWYDGLLTQAAQPGQLIAACAVARGGVLPLPRDGLEKRQKDEARALMNALWEHSEFLLERFDARTLAGFREAVEGPPLVAASARKPAWRFSRHSIKASLEWLLIAIVAAVVVIYIADDLLKFPNHQIHQSPPAQEGPSAQESPAALARRALDQTTSQWLELTVLGNKSTLVFFTQLVNCSAAIREIRYGLDRTEPDQVFPLPAKATTFPASFDKQTKTYVEAPPTLKFVSVQIVYADGSTSPVEVYRRE